MQVIEGRVFLTIKEAMEYIHELNQQLGRKDGKSAKRTTLTWRARMGKYRDAFQEPLRRRWLLPKDEVARLVFRPKERFL